VKFELFGLVLASNPKIEKKKRKENFNYFVFGLVLVFSPITRPNRSKAFHQLKPFDTEPVQPESRKYQNWAW
jgi:hypothetical protein